MRNRDKSAAQRSVRRRTSTVCVCLAVVLATAVFDLCQAQETKSKLSAPEEAAAREMREIADTTAILLNVYMDARVTDMCWPSPQPVNG
jgi:hypothetical protein